jgi:UDP-sulfoquinovose synthase
MKVLATAVTLVLLPCLATGFTAPSFARVVAGTAHNTPVSSTTSLYAANGENGLLEKKKVIVLGGDGFCGWPTSLYLSDQGHDVVIVDNLSRRNIDTELGCDSLTPIQPMEVR